MGEFFVCHAAIFYQRILIYCAVIKFFYLPYLSELWYHFVICRIINLILYVLQEAH